jgi:predicted O-linked N-acetylglucosamine transferase (SPINDLY family)
MSESIRETLELAIGRFQAGEVGEARSLAEAVLARRPDAPDAHAIRAACLEREGREEEALAAWETAVHLKPDYLLAQVNRAALLHRLRRLEPALAGFDAALTLAPDLALLHANRALVLADLARWPEAAEAARTALARDDGLASAHLALALAVERLEEPQAALPHLEAAVAADPGLLPARLAFLRILDGLGRRVEALAAVEAALATAPDQVDLLVWRGRLLRFLGRPAEALGPLEAALARDPGHAEARIEHGLALADLGKDEQLRAVAELEALAREQPDDPAHQLALGVALVRANQPARALPFLDRAAALDPGDPEIALERGLALSRLKRVDEAMACYRRAAELWPELAEPRIRLGRALMKLGESEAAAAELRAGLALDPSDAIAHSDLLLCLLFGGLAGLEELAAEHRAWGERFGHPTGRHEAWPNDRDPDKSLRIGLVSADLGQHPVSMMILPVLEALDRERYPTTVYSMRGKADAWTQAIRARVGTWRDVRGQDDRALAAQIRADAIDVLIDLAGHTANNRLPCFALKPAPVQVSWLGYPFTTGLPAIDAVLADAAMVRPGEERLYVETVLRFSGGRFCYAPPAYAAAVKLPPALRTGRVTFGSFNNTLKIGPEVMDLWSRVLQAVPGSRLLLKWSAFDQASEVARFRAAFGARGIGPDRLELRGHSSHADMLAEYGAVDIALDPFPYGGGMTSVEALWMGVPLVTLRGEHPMSRQGEAFLDQLGEPGWVAADEEAYLRIAAGLAASPGRLASLRLLQRERMQASPLCDGARAARELEALLREAWARWCAGRRDGRG